MNMKNRFVRFFFVISAVLVLLSITAADAGEKYKHDGFYLRLTTGAGGIVSREKAERTEVSFSGPGGMTSLGIGLALRENLMVNADLFGSVVRNPEMKIDGEKIGKSSVELQSTGLGVGLTYYIMPVNLYLSGSVGIASQSAKVNQFKYETKEGYGLNFLFGKEWWVGGSWGLGVAAQFFFNSVPDKNLLTGKEYRFKTTGIGILFSATYN